MVTTERFVSHGCVGCMVTAAHSRSLSCRVYHARYWIPGSGPIGCFRHRRAFLPTSGSAALSLCSWRSSNCWADTSQAHIRYPFVSLKSSALTPRPTHSHHAKVDHIRIFAGRLRATPAGPYQCIRASYYQRDVFPVILGMGKQT